MTLEQIKSSGTHFWDWVDRRTVFRRLIVVFSLYMTWEVTYNAWLFSAVSKYDGVGTAAIIAAIMVPVGAVQKFAFDIYSEARKEDKE
jgi:hypothetical protein